MSKTITLLEGQTSKIIYRPTFRGEPSLDDVTISKEDSILKDTIELGELKHNEDGVTGEIPFLGNGKNKSEITIVFVRGDGEGKIEGKNISTQPIEIIINPAELSYTSSGLDKIKQKDERKYEITIVLMNGDQRVPLNHRALENGSSDVFTIISKEEDKLIIEMKDDQVNTDPKIWNTDYSLILKLYSSSVSHPFTIYWKPVLTIIQTVAQVSLGDKGTLPFKIIDSKGDDRTSIITNVICDDEYFKFENDGSWEVIKEPNEDVKRSLSFEFDYNQLGFIWRMVETISIDVLSKPKELIATAGSPTTVEAFESGKLKFTLKDDKGRVVTDAKYVSSVSGGVFVRFGDGLTIEDGAKGIYSTTFESGSNSGSGWATITVDTKYGKFSFTTPSVDSSGSPVTITPNPTSISKTATDDKIVFTATKRKVKNGPMENVTGSLNITGLYGMNVSSGPTGNGPWTVGFKSTDQTSATGSGIFSVSGEGVGYRITLYKV